ncbi:MAG: flagellin [Bacteroidetes bacterium]|nr:flagellin [Bacteroidota bacterium]
MTSINAGGAFYRVQNELNNNSDRVAVSMQRLASGLQNVAPGQRTASTAVAFSMEAEASSLKIGMMNGTEALQALEMVTSDLSQLNDIVVRLEELHALGTNGFNTTEDTAAITAEANKLLTEMTAVTTGTTWKGNSIIGATAGANNVSFGRNTSAIDIRLDAFAIPEVALGFNTLGDDIYGSIDQDGSNGTYTTTEAAGVIAAVAAAGSETGSAEVAVDGEIFFENLTTNAKAAGAATVAGAATALAGSDISAGSAEAALSLLDLKTLVDNMRIDAGALYNQVSNVMSHMTALDAGYQMDVSSKMDVDFAGETTELAKGQILAQAGTAMLAQANAQGQGMLALLQS